MEREIIETLTLFTLVSVDDTKEHETVMTIIERIILKDFLEYIIVVLENKFTLFQSILKGKAIKIPSNLI